MSSCQKGELFELAVLIGVLVFTSVAGGVVTCSVGN